MSVSGAPDGRRQHYAGFYRASGNHPVALVHGNCQAEALRVVLDATGTFPLDLVRMPPVHELERSDLPHLSRLLRRCSVLLSQPVRAGYRGLPIGTRDLEPWLPEGSTVLRWPVLRYSGLHPYTAIVRNASEPGLEPPTVPYHDLRTVALAAGRCPRSGRTDPAALRSVAERSLAELRRREADLDTAVADRLVPLGAAAFHVVNHPGNEVLIAAARDLQRALGLPADAGDPGRSLLGRLKAPLEEQVLGALGLPDAPREHWIVDGAVVEVAEITAAHLRWYAAHPSWVTAALGRYAERMDLLGL